ncbi:MAG: hypothetical protein QM757_42635 [Paludibaculum sp.]
MLRARPKFSVGSMEMVTTSNSLPMVHFNLRNAWVWPFMTRLQSMGQE